MAEDCAGSGEWQFDILDLLSFLRGGDFPFGTGETLRVVMLFERLREQGREPRSPAAVAMWASPILCTSHRQQLLLRERVAAFVARADHTPRASPAPAGRRRLGRWRKLNWTILAVSFAIGLVAWSLYDPTGTPVPTQIPDTIRQLGSLGAPLIGASLLAGLAPFLWWLAILQLRRQRRPVLARRQFEGGSATALSTEASGLVAFGRGELSRAIQGWRTHRRLQSTQIDAKSSVSATIAASGRPVLVSRWRPTLPEYPIVVEAASTRDHLVELGRSLSRRLREENVDHALFFSGADPRWLRDADDIPTTLADVAARYRQDVLIFLGDGETLLDGRRGGWRDSLALEEWHTVVLLTPVAQSRWSHRERGLAEAGVLVLPATPKGIAQLGDFLRAEGMRLAPALDRAPTAPGILKAHGRNAPELHLDTAPPPDRREAIVNALALEISPNAFELVSVLAAFPELRPDLTSFVAGRLKSPRGNPLIGEADLAAISALPWFRNGRMPDWLRLDLVKDLAADRADEARALFAQWLSPTGDGGAGIMVTRETLGARVAETAERNPDSGLRDAIFMCFSKNDLSPLEVEAPERVIARIAPRVRRFERLGWVWTGMVAVYLAGVFLYLGDDLIDVLSFDWALNITFATLGAVVAIMLWIVHRAAAVPAAVPLLTLGLTEACALVVSGYVFPFLALADSRDFWIAAIVWGPGCAAFVPVVLRSAPPRPAAASESWNLRHAMAFLSILWAASLDIPPLLYAAILAFLLLILTREYGLRLVPSAAALLLGFPLVLVSVVVVEVILGLPATTDSPQWLLAALFLASLAGATIAVAVQARRPLRLLFCLLVVTAVALPIAAPEMGIELLTSALLLVWIVTPMVWASPALIRSPRAWIGPLAAVGIFGLLVRLETPPLLVVGLFGAAVIPGARAWLFAVSRGASVPAAIRHSIALYRTVSRLPFQAAADAVASARADLRSNVFRQRIRLWLGLDAPRA